MKEFMLVRRSGFLGIVLSGMRLLVVIGLFAPSIAAAKPEYRCLWADVFHDGFRTRAEADTLLATARSANYNAIFVQVRKACDAYYNSNIEPKNPAVESGFDPLGYLVERAHDTSGDKQRIEVHAWLVTYRCRITNDDIHEDPKHVWKQHPEWVSLTQRGNKEDKTSAETTGRSYLDPGVPAVIDYNLQVVRDILANYDVDGIHFDYFRYPDAKGPGSSWGYNDIAIERFNKLYGKSGKPDRNDPDFNEFRRTQIEQMARKTYAHVRAWRPKVKVSAATIVWGSIDRGFDRTDAYHTIFQDWPRMAQEGWLDLVMPMNYKRESVSAQARDHREWAQFLGDVARKAKRFGINSVDGETLNSLPDVVAQMTATRDIPGLAGLATYCYAETRKEWRRDPPDTTFFDTIKETFYSRPAEVPEMKWLSEPTEGLVKGVITRDGKTWDGARVRAGDQTTITDGTGFYAFARLRPGDVTVEVLDGDTATASKSVEIVAGKVAEAPIAVK